MPLSSHPEVALADHLAPPSFPLPDEEVHANLRPTVLAALMYALKEWGKRSADFLIREGFTLEDLVGVKDILLTCLDPALTAAMMKVLRERDAVPQELYLCQDPWDDMAEAAGDANIQHFKDWGHYAGCMQGASEGHPFYNPDYHEEMRAEFDEPGDLRD